MSADARSPLGWLSRVRARAQATPFALPLQTRTQGSKSQIRTLINDSKGVVRVWHVALLPSPSQKKQGVCVNLCVRACARSCVCLCIVLHPKALSCLIHHPQEKIGYPPVLVLIITSYRKTIAWNYGPQLDNARRSKCNDWFSRGLTKIIWSGVIGRDGGEELLMLEAESLQVGH